MKSTNFGKVTQLYNKNQFIIEDNERIIFQSYNSTIAIYDKATNSLTLGKHWDYSTTTSKHLYLFISDYVTLKIDDTTYLDYELRTSNNKRKVINKLIDSNIINYDNGLV